MQPQSSTEAPAAPPPVRLEAKAVGGRIGLGTTLGAIALAVAVAAVGLNFVIPGPSSSKGTYTTSLWATVSFDGSVVNGGGVNSTTSGWISPLAGNYQVFFDRNVSSCAYVATVGISGNPPPSMIGVAPRSGQGWAVFVETYNATGIPTNQSFELAVFC